MRGDTPRHMTNAEREASPECQAARDHYRRVLDIDPDERAMQRMEAEGDRAQSIRDGYANSPER